MPAEPKEQARPDTASDAADFADAANAGASAELRALAVRLRDAAQGLPASVRSNALADAEEVHAHASQDSPDTETMSLHLQRLAPVAELTPLVNALLEAISGVGL